MSADSLLTEMARLIQEEAIKMAGLDEATARTIAMASVDRISQELGGYNLYITKDAAIAKRHREIWAEFRGDNYSELAARFGLSVPYVYHVVARMRAWDKAQRQPDLFQKPAS